MLLQGSCAESIVGAKCIGRLEWYRLPYILSRAYARTDHIFNKKIWSFIDEDYMHLSALLKAAQMSLSGTTCLATHIPFRFF